MLCRRRERGPSSLWKFSCHGSRQLKDWPIISKILDGGSGRLRIAFNNGTSIYTMTWYQGNRSFGSIGAIPSSTTGLNTNNWDCEATSDFVLHCLYQRRNVLYYRNVTLSGTLGTEVTMSSSITGNFYPTVRDRAITRYSYLP